VGIPTLLAALVAAGFPSADGVSLRAPAGWTAWKGPPPVAQGVTNPVLRVELFSAAGGVVQVRELVPPLLTREALPSFPPRPRRFALADLRPTAGCALPGSVGTSFRERGRAFFVVVRRPTPAVARALDTLTVESR
jgi:hypothetical protein